MDILNLFFPNGWQHYLLGGLTIGAGVALLYVFNGWVGGMSSVFSSSWSLVGGFLVGYGARLGNGCTSGHGICGLGALQLPSLGAVLTFMATAFFTANLLSITTKGLA